MSKKENNRFVIPNDIETIEDDIDILFEDYEEFDTPRMATIEYQNNSIVYEDYSKLDLYLKNVFIPRHLNKITKKNEYNEEEFYYSISLYRILDLKLCHRELLYVYNYLKNEGIVIRGFFFINWL